MTENLTIANVLEQISGDEGLSKQRRSDIRSGVNTLCAVLNLQPESTLADPEQFQKQLAGLTPAMAGLTKTRLSNCKSALAAALKHAKTLKFQRRSSTPLMPAYGVLLRDVTEEWHEKKLKRFFRFASGLGVPPEEVSDNTFDAFLTALEKSVVKDARTADRETRKLWNRYAGSATHWPATAITVPDYRTRYTLPREAFPDSLWEDLEAYLDARRAKSSSDDVAALLARLAADDEITELDAKPIREKTAHLIAYRVMQAASILVQEGAVHPGDLCSLADIATPERIAKVVAFYIRPPKKNRNSQAHGLATDLYMIAKLWVRVDEKYLEKLRKMRKAVKPGANGMPEKSRRALAPFKVPQNVRKFLELPERVVKQVESLEHPTTVDANRVATALWIKIAQHAPLRISNILGIDLDRNLIHSHSGKDAKVSLFFRAEEVKNNKALEIPLPDSTTKLLRIYLTKYRKLLVSSECPWLFPALDGGMKDQNGMATAIKKLMDNELGFAITPHDFRRVAAKLYLSVHPGREADVQILLGHKKLETTLGYIDSNTDEVFAHLDATLLGLQNPSIKTGG